MLALASSGPVIGTAAGPPRALVPISLWPRRESQDALTATMTRIVVHCLCDLPPPRSPRTSGHAGERNAGSPLVGPQAI